MAAHTLKVDWRYTTVVDGVQCVMMDGMITTLLEFVCNWDLDHQEI